MMNQQYFKAYPRDQVEALHQKAKALVIELPVLRISPDASEYDNDPPTAIKMEQAEVDQIPTGHIIELAHLSKLRGQTQLDWKGYPRWADHLAVELDHVQNITSEQAPKDYCALYLARIYAPSWPAECELTTPEINLLKGGVFECRPAFSIGPGQFAEIPIKYSESAGKLVLDP